MFKRHYGVLWDVPGCSGVFRGVPFRGVPGCSRVFRGVPGCSEDVPGVFRGVPGVFRVCSGVFRDVPGFTETLQNQYKKPILLYLKGKYIQ